MHRIDLQRVDLNLLLTFDTLMQEGSVSRAAGRLHRTQSAVSHALARLRRQLGDPLLVNIEGRMRPSPFALELAQEVRPILRLIQRALTPRQDFLPAASTRAFRIVAPDFAMGFFPRLLARLRAEAPGINVEWLIRGDRTALDVADGRVDLAIVRAAARLPDGVDGAKLGELRWACFARAGHPALMRWNARAWSAWPHVTVGVGGSMANPVTETAGAQKLERRVAATVPTFSAVAPLLAGSDLLATLPVMVLADAAERFNLSIAPVPFPIAPVAHAILWSARLARDPAIQWLRAIVADVFAEQVEETNRKAMRRRAPHGIVSVR